MTMTSDVKQRIDVYLGRLRSRLRGVNEQEVREIVEELRSHIVDKVAASGEATPAGVDAVLAALGGPEELANEYLTDNLLARAEASRSPARILESLFRWASLSVAGFFVLVGSIMGYFLGIVFLLVAVLRPFHPQTAGLWLLRDSAGDSEISLRLGFGSAPVAGRDVLGWWIVPLGLLAGCALVMLTTRFALWCARQYRRSHLLPRS
jgi:HAAS domain-containing protein